MEKQGKLIRSFMALEELAAQRKVPVLELLIASCAGNLVVGVPDFGAAHLKSPPAGVDRPTYESDPSQFSYCGVLTLDREDLQRIASKGETLVNVGYIHWSDGRHGVLFDPPRKVTVDDLVVPMVEAEEQIAGGLASADDNLSEKREITLLRIIGVLGLVIAKGKGQAGQWTKELNSTALSTDVENTLASLSDAQKAVLNTHGVSDTNLRKYIVKGLAALKK